MRTSGVGPTPWRRPRRGLLPVVVVGLIQVIGASLAERGQPERLDSLGYTLLVAGAAALVLRRRAPVAALAVTTAALVGYLALPYPGGPVMLAALVALFAAVRAGRWLGTWTTVVLGYAAYLGLGHLTAELAGRPLDPPPGPVQALVVAGWVGAALAVASAAKVRGEHYAQLAQWRAEQARTRAEQQRRQASEERLRIAQELHDVLGHHLSLINVQAGVGLHLMDSQPEQARAALSAIKQASAEALREVRSVLAALRPDDEAAPRTPAPGLDRVGDLAADAGQRVSTTVLGLSRPLPPEVDRAAYRIVQEALTNVRRHAGDGASATVTIEYADGELRVTVDDDGRAAPGLSGVESGNGIPGMRERAAALGGDLSAGPRPGGGFRVRARLPLEEVAR
ncbi:MAG TPA: sensor histidine kinase [Micromonosporaceae bacterium]|nr:sensor histidine kinase [Micromonosporaceae bacterium]